MTPGGPVLRASVTLALVVAGLLAADQALERFQSADVARRSEIDYRAGLLLLKQGKAAEAVDLLREAHGLARENTDYQLALISALIAEGKPGDADQMVDEALQRAPNDGQVNLTAARLKVREGHDAEAESFFHRAIYGQWPQRSQEPRLAARRELIEVLRNKGRRQELLPELISLEAETREDSGRRIDLARLYLEAGANGRAAGVFEDLARRDPKDEASYAGLGEARLQQGNYAAAHAAFRRAFFLKPADGSINERLRLLNTVASLDPTVRRLTSREKYQRSLQVLYRAREDLGTCSAGQDLAAQAAGFDARNVARPSNEDSEELLDLAEKIWRERVRSCGAMKPNEEPLRLVMTRLTQ
jgi:Tfp pilus assembly protein PilF